MSALSSSQSLGQELCRLARFGANLTDSHSCFILLPERVQTLQSGRTPRGTEPPSIVVLRLAGCHSLAEDVRADCLLRMDSGLIGWVAKHRRSIHVSPFEHESSTLGTYAGDHQLKSFIGIPVALGSDDQDTPAAGVIACDSKKSFAFSKLQGKLLEDLAGQVAHTVHLMSAIRSNQSDQLCWEKFLQSAELMLQSLGTGSVEVMRVRAAGFDILERDLGTAAAIERVSLLWRLLRQALPPHYPFYVLPSGDAIIVCDNMMSAFCENKVRAIGGHVLGNRYEPKFLFARESVGSRANRGCELAEIISRTGDSATTSPDQEKPEYEYRRA